MNVEILVGQTETSLVLEYRAGSIKKNLCHYYPITEESSKTASFLCLEMDGRDVNFKALNLPEYGITPTSKKRLDELIQAYLNEIKKFREQK